MIHILVIENFYLLPSHVFLITDVTDSFSYSCISRYIHQINLVPIRDWDFFLDLKSLFPWELSSYPKHLSK